jgi:hypothetical protein
MPTLVVYTDTMTTTQETTMTTPIKFQVGEVYMARSACDYETVFSWMVTARTAKFITVFDGYNHKRVGVRVTRYNGEEVEAAQPHGNYSMTPVIFANRHSI